ncbi:hypothetical protein KPH14_003393 [Odynerus spinipes]|uniref:G-patch domain-containing protein n=1 Tax=Odynerus spinipes TaxID=1348599 RepID=A0AAD9RDY2_9HYME|nr:hypothetical protein KPH14_003393 [Odynerus spinipes]
MAMLAEPRRRQRWTLNPRGKDWSNDTTKFGQRMLEKMGWTTGKGLGVNEQGMTEHVKMKVKNDTNGIGFKNDQDKAWTEHQQAFDNFLSHLQENQDLNVTKETETKNSATSIQSLELKSKQSRARVHYQKFTRGKDVKKYSAKDLADILGGKNILKKQSNIEEQEEKDTDMPSVENIAGGSFTINRGSITDYFKKKTSHFLKDKDNNNSLSKDASNSENLHNTNDIIIDEDNMKGLNKRKRGIFTESNVQNLDKKQNFVKKIKIDTDPKSCKEGFVNMALDLDNQATESHIKNKFEVPRVQLGLTNNALDLTDETYDKKRVTFNDHVEYSTDSVRKKKSTGKLDKFEVDSKKHRKKSKQIINIDVSNKIGFVNEALDINSISDESRDNEANEYKSKKNKKQKQQKIPSLETIEEASEEGNTNNSRETENLDKNLVENANKEEHVYVEENVHIKKKKKKAKKHIPVADNTEDAIIDMQVDIDYIKKEGKTKKKKNKCTKMNDDLETTREDEEHQIIEENIIDVKSKEASKLERKQDNKDINKDQKYKLKGRKSKEVQNEDQDINIVAQESMTNTKRNTDVKCSILKDEIIVKAQIKNDIIVKKDTTDKNKNSKDSIDIEKDITDTETWSQDVELTTINSKESTVPI